MKTILAWSLFQLGRLAGALSLWNLYAWAMAKSFDVSPDSWQKFEEKENDDFFDPDK